MVEEMSAERLVLRLRAVALFNDVMQDDVIRAFCVFLRDIEQPPQQRINAYSNFVAQLYKAGGDLGAHLLARVLESENPLVKLRAAGQPVLPAMATCMLDELQTFDDVAQLVPGQIAKLVHTDLPLPLWQNTGADFKQIYANRLAEIATRGYGIFATHRMFTLGGDGVLLPVKNLDPQQLCQLTGYERERQQVVVNTKALLKGLPANNILLYGDAGTGKSSTVKALANEYADQGLRLVEVRKNQLYQIPLLMDTLGDNPLKFILFIDDLSFPADDGSFTELKAILEGNVAARPANIVVYATSNRRHMVREKFTSRQGDDVHAGDTREEEASLAARFGLTITFLRPDKDLYSEIVLALAEEYSLEAGREQLLAQAEAHAIRHGGRSPRTARQFVEYQKAVENHE